MDEVAAAFLALHLGKIDKATPGFPETKLIKLLPSSKPFWYDMKGPHPENAGKTIYL